MASAHFARLRQQFGGDLGGTIESARAYTKKHAVLRPMLHGVGQVEVYKETRFPASFILANSYLLYS